MTFAFTGQLVQWAGQHWQMPEWRTDVTLPIIRQAIETRYLGPSNTKGGRIRARAWAGSITVPYDHALSVEGNHRAAAMELVAKFGWCDQSPAEHWATGGNAKGDGYVHVSAGRNLWTRKGD